jgi:hypothetical protein
MTENDIGTAIIAAAMRVHSVHMRDGIVRMANGL